MKANSKFKNLNVVAPMAMEDLEVLHTGSLLKRLQSLRALQTSFEVSDWTEAQKKAVEEAGLIAFKESTLWKAAFSDVKKSLSSREHIPRGSKEKRQTAARGKHNR